VCIKRKVVLMALHSHLVKTQNYNWAQLVLWYLQGRRLNTWQVLVINLALDIAGFKEYKING